MKIAMNRTEALTSPMSGIFYKSLMVFLSLTLILSLATWLKSRQDLRAMTAANVSLTNALGRIDGRDWEKNRQMDRLGQLPCGTGEKPRPSVFRTD